MGCNFDGGLTWLALGKARAGSELDSFRVEIADVDLERVDATISRSNMDMFMPYGQGPVVGPINVSRISIGPRTVDGVANGNVVTVHFNILSPIRRPQIFCSRTRFHTSWFSTTREPVVGAETPGTQDAWAIGPGSYREKNLACEAGRNKLSGHRHRGARCRSSGQEVHNAAVKMLAYEIAQALVLLSRTVSCGSSTFPMVQWLNCRNPTCSRSSPRKRFSS